MKSAPNGPEVYPHNHHFEDWRSLQKRMRPDRSDMKTLYVWELSTHGHADKDQQTESDLHPVAPRDGIANARHSRVASQDSTGTLNAQIGTVQSRLFSNYECYRTPPLKYYSHKFQMKLRGTLERPAGTPGHVRNANTISAWAPRNGVTTHHAHTHTHTHPCEVLGWS